MYPHRIRLRGPWECEPLSCRDGSPAPARRRMTMPCRWADGGLAGFAGRVRFVRRFGLPRQIDAHERLWLSFDGLSGTAVALLNGAALGRMVGTGSAFDVTAWLRDRNELRVEMDGGEDGGLWGEVALVIRATAYLADLRRATGGVTGIALGTAARPLDLYLLHDGQSAAHAMVMPLPEGQRFALAPEAGVPPAAQEVRVDLIDGGVVWDSQIVAE